MHSWDDDKMRSKLNDWFWIYGGSIFVGGLIAVAIFTAFLTILLERW